MRIRVGDVRLFFDVQGAKHPPGGEERPTVLVVHTGPGIDHMPYRDHVGPALAGVAQMLYVDLRGHGRSDLSGPAHWNVDTWAADLALLLDALDVDRVTLLANGWGCYPGVRFAARNPRRVTRVALANPAARFVAARVVAAYDVLGGPAAGEVAHRYFTEPGEQTAAEFLRVCFPLAVPGLGGLDVLVGSLWNIELGIHWLAGEAHTIELGPELASIQAPVLVLAAGRDPQTPLASILEAYEALPPELRELRSFPDAHHSIFREVPQALDALRAFVTP